MKRDKGISSGFRQINDRRMNRVNQIKKWGKVILARSKNMTKLQRQCMWKIPELCYCKKVEALEGEIEKTTILGENLNITSLVM